MKWLDASLQPFFSPKSAKKTRAKIDRRKEIANNVTSLLLKFPYLGDVSHNFIYLLVARKGAQKVTDICSNVSNRKDFMLQAKKLLNKGK